MKNINRKIESLFFKSISGILNLKTGSNISMLIFTILSLILTALLIIGGSILFNLFVVKNFSPFTFASVEIILFALLTLILNIYYSYGIFVNNKVDQTVFLLPIKNETIYKIKRNLILKLTTIYISFFAIPGAIVLLIIGLPIQSLALLITSFVAFLLSYTITYGLVLLLRLYSSFLKKYRLIFIFLFMAIFIIYYLSLLNGKYLTNLINLDAIRNFFIENYNTNITVAIFLGIFSLIGTIIFFKGTPFFEEKNFKLVPVKNKKLKKSEEIQNDYKKSNTTIQIFKFNLEIMMKNPESFFFMLPSFIFVIVIINMISQGLSTGSVFNPGDFTIDPLGFLAAFVFFLFLGALSMLGSTITSLGGKSAYILKLIPITPKKLIYTQVLFSTLIDILIAFLLSLFFLYGKISILYVVIALVVKIIYSLICSTIDLYIDMFKPKVNWNSYREIKNKNFTPLISLLIESVLIGILLIPSIITIIASNHSITATLISLLVTAIITFIIVIVVVNKTSSKLVNHMEL